MTTADVYERLTPKGKKATFKTLLLTQLVAGIWHGLFPGYALFFATSAFMFESAKVIYRYEQVRLPLHQCRGDVCLNMPELLSRRWGVVSCEEPAVLLHVRCVSPACSGTPAALAIHPDIPTVAVCEVPVHRLHPELQRLCVPGESLSLPRTPSLPLTKL